MKGGMNCCRRTPDASNHRHRHRQWELFLFLILKQALNGLNHVPTTSLKDQFENTSALAWKRSNQQAEWIRMNFSSHIGAFRRSKYLRLDSQWIDFIVLHLSIYLSLWGWKFCAVFIRCHSQAAFFFILRCRCLGFGFYSDSVEECRFRFGRFVRLDIEVFFRFCRGKLLIDALVFKISKNSRTFQSLVSTKL